MSYLEQDNSALTERREAWPPMGTRSANLVYRSLDLKIIMFGEINPRRPPICHWLTPIGE